MSNEFWIFRHDMTKNVTVLYRLRISTTSYYCLELEKKTFRIRLRILIKFIRLELEIREFFEIITVKYLCLRINSEINIGN